MSKYDDQAEKFLASTGATVAAKYLETGKYFDDDKEIRDIYEITITRGTRKYSFRFGQSINNSGKYHAKGGYGKGLNGDNTVLPANWKPPFMGDYLRGRDYEGNKDFSAPSAYDVLAAVQKYDVETFENFCSDFGYDTDSRKAEKAYKAVVEEYRMLCTLFSDSELEAMQEIN